MGGRLPSFTVLLEHPASRAAPIDPNVRRALMGWRWGLTAVVLTYSPWGKRTLGAT